MCAGVCLVKKLINPAVLSNTYTLYAEGKINSFHQSEFKRTSNSQSLFKGFNIVILKNKNHPWSLVICEIAVKKTIFIIFLTNITYYGFPLKHVVLIKLKTCVWSLPSASISGGPDIHVNEGSTINLTCIVKFSPEPPSYIFWYHYDELSEECIDFAMMSVKVKIENSRYFLKITTQPISSE
ncbi:neurotrimin-like isoform X2 [Aphis craccivora]|uniref:Neurotrimin-like isoform X2 n=1 Tax=Aphis craccivora TaxID=307492 RepID=A0A6G0ZQ63_APHCR|nr:neurotrimin-like isoform X2 [Aphis craccivora]